MIVAIAGTDVTRLRILHGIFAAKGLKPWVVWDATETLPPTGFPQLITFTAILYADECQILATKRILDRTNADHVWIIWSDIFTAKSISCLDDSRTEDVVLGEGFSRLSRKALECISLNFGSDNMDWSSLTIFRCDDKKNIE